MKKEKLTSLPPAGPCFNSHGVCENLHGRDALAFPGCGNFRSLRPISSAEQRNFADGKERRVGRNAAVAEPVAWGLGASQSSGLRFCPLAGSLARGRVDFTRRASTTSGVESQPARSGVSKFGCDEGRRKNGRLNCQPRHEHRELKRMVRSWKIGSRERRTENAMSKNLSRHFGQRVFAFFISALVRKFSAA